jgi:hypothetical protein
MIEEDIAPTLKIKKNNNKSVSKREEVENEWNGARIEKEKERLSINTHHAEEKRYYLRH